MFTRRRFVLATLGVSGLLASPRARADNDTWRLRQDNVQLQGTVDKHEFSGSDNDWNLNVRPAPDYMEMLKNEAGIANGAQHPEDLPGIIQCEISPAGTHGGGTNEAKYFGLLQGKGVTVVGAFVEDTKHHNKTEIHPITWISCFDMPYWHVFAFSNDPVGFPNNIVDKPPFFSNDNRVANIDLPFYQWSTPLYQIVEEIPAARSVKYRVHTVQFTDGSLRPFLGIYIETGTPQEHKGFYYAKILAGQGWWQDLDRV